MKIDDLREAQQRFIPTYHKEKIGVSIDRLTVLVDTPMPTKTLFDLQRTLGKRLEGNVDFAVRSVYGNSFSLERGFESGEYVNLIYFEVIDFGGEALIRVDFNPNTLREYEAMSLWHQIISFLRLNSTSIHLSRFDLAFDIFNMPSVITAKHVKGGIKSTFYYGRASELETVYWGSRSSNVQVRLYDKNKERMQKKRFSEIDLETFPYWWRFEMQLRTKVINADMVSEVVERLRNFGIYDYAQLGGNRAFAFIFLHDPSALSYVFNNLAPNSVRVNKQRLRKRLKALENKFSDKLVQALREQSSELAKELKQFTNEFLGFE